MNLNITYFDNAPFEEHLLEVLKKGPEIDSRIRINRESINVRNDKNGSIGLRCPVCQNPVFIRRSKNGNFHACHYSEQKNQIIVTKANYILPVGVKALKDCPLKKTDKKKRSDGQNYESECQRHLDYVDALHVRVENTPLCSHVKKEKYIFSKTNPKEGRRPDVQCIYRGQLIAFEFQLSWLSDDDIAAREAFYRREGIILIWLYPLKLDDGKPAVSIMSNATRQKILAGSFNQTEKIGALVLYFDRHDNMDQFSVHFKFEPYLKMDGELILRDVAENSQRYLTHAHKQQIGLEDLIFSDEGALPRWWPYDTVEKITEYFASHESPHLRVIEKKNDVDQIDVNKIKLALNPYINAAETEDQKINVRWIVVFIELLEQWVLRKNTINEPVSQAGIAAHPPHQAVLEGNHRPPSQI